MPRRNPIPILKSLAALEVSSISMWPNTGLWLVEKEEDGSWLLWGCTSLAHIFPLMYTSRRVQRYMSCPWTPHRSGFSIPPPLISHSVVEWGCKFIRGLQLDVDQIMLNWDTQTDIVFGYLSIMLTEQWKQLGIPIIYRSSFFHVVTADQHYATGTSQIFIEK